MVSVEHVSQDNLLGEYLRARRELVRPEDVGLPVNGVRRVAGRRREEVAMLAGISSDYYLRLEQGRDRNPSVQVLEALARALRLDEAATDYLLRLAAPRPKKRRRPHKETVPPSIRQLLDVIGLPAFVEGRYLDVLAANDLATALSPSMRAGQNRLMSMFLDPAEKAFYVDWEKSIGTFVASSGRWWVPTPTTRVSSRWSGSYRHQAIISGGCGRDRTYTRASRCRPACAILRSAT